MHGIPFRCRRALVPALLALPLAGAALRAQQPVPPPAAAPPPLAAYRAPVIALVQPVDGGTLYADRPVIVLRFAPGEPLDPIDVGSFTIGVDGHDRTSLFQRSAGEAWGPLAPTSGDDAALAPGPHRISARICSARGACAVTHATVTVLPALTGGAAAAAPSSTRSRKQRLLDAALSAARRLLVP